MPSRVLCRSAKEVIGLVSPVEAEQVSVLVQRAADRGWRVHAISSGMNWGMGSFLPSADNRLIVDLSGLNRIGPLDQAAGTIRIEAGVSQKQLYDWLQANAPEFAFNVTGSSERTSIIGNAMQRGLGYDGSRADELFGHEVVLPDGSVHGPDADWFSTTGSIPVGPRLDALWSQSDFGIVTAGWMRLRRKQDRELAVVLSGDLERVFTTLQSAYRRNLLSLPVHMAGSERAKIVGKGLLWRHWGREPTEEEVAKVFPPSQGMTAIAAIRGEKAVVATQLKTLRQVSAAGVAIRGLDAGGIDRAFKWAHRLGLKSKRDFLGAIRPLLALTWGVPSDAGMAAVRIAPQGDPDKAEVGMVYFNAVSAFELKQSQEVESVVQASLSGVSLTRVFQDASQIVHIFSVEFKDEDTAVTHRKILAASEELRKRGFPPYRLGSVRPDFIDSQINESVRGLFESVAVNLGKPEGAR